MNGSVAAAGRTTSAATRNVRWFLTAWLGGWAVTFYAASLIYVVRQAGLADAGFVLTAAFDVADAITPVAKLTLGGVTAVGLGLAVLVSRWSSLASRALVLASPVLGAAAMAMMPSGGFPDDAWAAALAGGALAGGVAAAAWGRPRKKARAALSPRRRSNR